MNQGSAYPISNRIWKKREVFQDRFEGPMCERTDCSSSHSKENQDSSWDDNDSALIVEAGKFGHYSCGPVFS